MNTANHIGKMNRIMKRSMIEWLTEYRVRQMCINNQVPHIMAGKKYLINRDLFLRYLRGETA